MATIVMYSTPTCMYCKLAKSYFGEKGVGFIEKNVATDLEARKEMVDKSGQLGVPVIDIDGNIIVGFDKERIAQILGK